MRKYLIPLFLTLLFIAAFAPFLRSTDTPAYITASPTATATCGSITSSFTPTNAGDTWVMMVGAAGSSTNPVPILVSDNNGGTWVLQGMVSGANGVISVFTSPNHPSGATTITITDNAGTGTCGQVVYMYEFSNLFVALPDAVATNTAAGSSTTWSAGTTASLSQVTEVAVAGFLDKSGGSTIASASGATNGFTQPAAGVKQDSGKEVAMGTTYKITAATTALSTHLTASASVGSSVSILQSFMLGGLPVPLCSPGFNAVGFGCASQTTGAACPSSTCDAQQICFFGPANPAGATPAPICLAQCTLINSFSFPDTIYVNGCNPSGPCPCSGGSPTSTPTQAVATATPTYNAPTATPTFTAVPTPTVPPPFPTPTTGPTATPNPGCVQPYSSGLGVCVTGTPCFCGDSCASGVPTTCGRTVCPSGAQLWGGSCILGTSPSTAIFEVPACC